MTGRWSGGTQFAIVLAFVALLIWLLRTLAHGNPILGEPDMQAGLHAVAIVCAAVAGMLLGGRVLLAFALPDGQATGFQRALVYGVLAGGVSALLLAHFGFDLTAVLTTSAIITAAVGLAMQPTLSSVIAGLTVHLDDVIRVGDGVQFEGEWARVVALTWRAVVARTLRASLIVIPHSRLADQTVRIIRQGQSCGTVTYFCTSLDERPERVSALVAEMIGDMAAVDSTIPVAVALSEFEPQNFTMRFCARYRVKDFLMSPLVEAEVVRRIWYVLQRNNIRLPINSFFYPDATMSQPMDAANLRRCVGEALEAGGLQALGIADRVAAVERLVAKARLLLYATDERLIVPEETGDCLFLLIHGQAVRAHEFGLDEDEASRPALQPFRLGPEPEVRRIAERLAADIGPYAEIAVRRAALRVHSLAALCQEVAAEIDDEPRRLRFLADVQPVEVRRYGPGLVFHARRNASGALICHLPLRAEAEVGVLAIDPALLRTLTAGERLAAE